MALDFGMQGLMIETHINPDKALSDSKQQITPKELIQMLHRLKARDAVPTDTQVKAKITHLRSEISRIDSRIIQDLADRMKCVEEIGDLKKEHQIPVLQIDRWENLLKDHIDKATQKKLDSEFIKAIFELVHAEAVKKQL